MLLTPDRYDDASVFELMIEAANGRIGFDQTLIRSILARDKEETAQALADFYSDMEEEVRIDLSGETFHLLRALRTTKAIPVYAELIRDAGDEDPSEVYEAMAELGADAIPQLLEMHSAAEAPEEQRDIEFLLAGLGVKDPRIEELLRARLESLPTEAAINISLYGDRAMKPLLEERLSRLDPEARGFAHDKHELEFAIDQLSVERVKDEPEPFNILELYPESAPPIFEVLEPDEMVEFLDHPDAETRRLAAESLGNEDLDPATVSRLLQLAENDQEVTVRAQAWQSLAPALEDDNVRAKIEEKLYDKDAAPLERAGAACALVEGNVTSELADALVEFYKNELTRALALKAMWHSFDKQFSRYFPPHLDDQDREVQRQAIWGVGYFGLGHEAGRLEKLFEDPDAREHALFAYALCCPGDVSRGRAKGMLSRINDLADGLSHEEEEVVKAAIDQRLSMHGLEPVFHKH